MIRPPPRSNLFPYTTLFPSSGTTINGVSSFNDTSKVAGSGIDYSGFSTATVTGTNTAVSGVAGNFDDGVKQSATNSICFSNRHSLNAAAALFTDETSSFKDT